MTQEDQPREPGSGRVGAELVDRLVPLSFLIQAAFEQACTGHGVSPAQARLLGVLQGRSPRMAELARLLGVEKSSLTGLVDRAAAHGLVCRVVPPDDRRALHVELTERGRQVEAAFRRGNAQRVSALLGPLPEADRLQLTRLLDAVLTAAAAGRP
jgi:MarR family transcriptional regulator, lower aerobic nicotinate degradation pathway regulator